MNAERAKENVQGKRMPMYIDEWIESK